MTTTEKTFELPAISVERVTTVYVDGEAFDTLEKALSCWANDRADDELRDLADRLNLLYIEVYAMPGTPPEKTAEYKALEAEYQKKYDELYEAALKYGRPYFESAFNAFDKE